MKKSDLIFIFSSFIIWRIAIFIFALLSIKFLPVFSHNYFGGGYSNYTVNPLFWGHLNFDGEHYLAIAQNGYQPLEYFFFPLFTIAIRFFSLAKDQVTLVWTGLIISNLLFLFALIGIYKLVEIDYKENVAKLTLILMLFFPTSFYFATYYTESLFLILVVWAFYLARRGNFLVASILAAFASAARVVGVVLLPVLLIEYFLKSKNKNLFVAAETILISPLGLVVYLYFLLKQTGDPLIFLHQVSIFGEQRSSTLILLPQVIYRYVFKILPHVTYYYFPNVFTTYLEFIIGILFLALIIYGFWKLRISYSIYALLVYLVPTLAGSFSSMPRYVLVVFPVFILVALFLSKVPRVYKYILFSVMLILLVFSTAMFWRGYWLS